MIFTRRFLLFCLLAIAAPAWSQVPPEKTAEGFRIPPPDPELAFPADHGSHPDYRIEWWYLTGHLTAEADSDRRFGVQATFFRLAQRPESDPAETHFGDAQWYLAHMALTDVANGRFYHEERLNREGWDARAKVGDLDVRNGNWSLRRISGFESEESATGVMELMGGILSEARFELELSPVKPVVRFGENGLSRKGAEPSAASLYLTFPRLAADGTLFLGEETVPVRGELWMDHEICSSQLGRDQVGWDWLSVHFFDGRELMAYVLRQENGEPDQFSSLSWIDESGKVTRYGVDAFEWRFEGDWVSPETGSRYPVRPRVTARDPRDGTERTFRIEPLLDAQEMTGGLGGVSYWEGACEVIDEKTKQVVGRAYLELTGYAAGDDLGRRLRGEE